MAVPKALERLWIDALCSTKLANRVDCEGLTASLGIPKPAYI